MLTVKIDGHSYRVVVETLVHRRETASVLVVEIDTLPRLVRCRGNQPVEPVAAHSGTDAFGIIVYLVWMRVKDGRVQGPSVHRDHLDDHREEDD
jgi:hypothetical protein